MPEYNPTLEQVNKQGRTGLPKPIPELDQSDVDRFYSKIDRTPGQGPQGRCHRWIGTFNSAPSPYGVFKAKRKMIYAHRLAFILEYECDPTPLLICHYCDQTWCVNPECFFISDNEGNTADSTQKKRRASGDKNGQRLHPEKTVKGTKQHLAKLNDDLVKWIVEEKKTGCSNASIARKVGVTPRSVTNVLEGYTWNHVTGLPQKFFPSQTKNQPY